MNDGEVKKERQERQQRKLIKAILDRDGRYLAEEDVELSPEERERFYRLVSTGVIHRDDFVRMVAGIKLPEAEDSFVKIASSNYKRRILAYFAGVGFDNFEKVTADTVADFLKKYSNPYAFAAPKMDFLMAIKKSNPMEKYEVYAREMREFVAAVYGQEQEYAMRAKELLALAADWQIDEDAKKFAGGFLAAAEIEGDAWLQNGVEYRLTPELLDQGGLAPRFLIEMGGVEIALSRVFMADVHEAAIAYVKFDNTVHVRGYYRSNSQGMWRYLPDYIAGNGEIAWYGVGYNEESLALPLKLQKQLNMIADKGIWSVPGVNMAFFLGGTARKFAGTVEEYKAREDNFEGAYYKEVKREPRLNFGWLSSEKRPPESIEVFGGAAPNFRNQLDHYEMRTEMYGEVAVRQFPSMDDEVRWMMLERGFGLSKKAWVGGVEVNSPITSMGLRREWVSSGDVATPLYEYQSMADGYGEEITGEASFVPSNVPGMPDIPVVLDDAGGKVPEGYLSMWNKYLKLMPVVQKFLYTWREG